MISVLTADDHPVVRDGLRALLDGETDITVVGVATTGTEAVTRATELAPDVVLMDIAMPELSGLDATARIRRNLPNTQVVILSMHATSEHLHQALSAGALGFVIKSSAGTEVVTAVRAAAMGRRHLSPPLRRMAVAAGLDCTGGSEPSSGPLASLSPRERQVLHLVVQGCSSVEIAQRLYLSPGTVDTYRSRAMRKLGVDDLVGLVRFAVEHGLTPP